jgi:hypothetical protein
VPSLPDRPLTARRHLRAGRGRWLRPLAALLALAAVAVAAVLLTGQRAVRQPRRVESIFQDDQLLLYQPLTPAGNAEVSRTLLTLRALGVDEVRLSVVWYYLLAPDHDGPTPPPGFATGDSAAANPASYAPAAWLPYDRAIALAHEAGLQVLLTVTAPGPLWAMGRGAPNPKTATHWFPDAPAFGAFVEAVGRRYSGSYQAVGMHRALPRVSSWSIWNEPNQEGWLAPQSSPSGATAVAPRLYRALVDAAYRGLRASGHPPTRDTILIGELAPEGSTRSGPMLPLTPLPFIRELYCVGADFRPLRGAAALAAGCRAGGSPGQFVRAHPGLFRATGFAHHPYSFLTAPDVPLSQPGDAPLSELPRLEHTLDAAFAAYGQSRRLPIYLTEYGYETNPPNPFRGVSLRNQSLYLDEAEYMAWRDPRVRALAQFELQDSAPDALYPRGSFGYWSTFQTGLEFLGGRPKPSLNAYRLPIFLPSSRPAADGTLLVWGMLRPAAPGTRSIAAVQWRPPGGAYRDLASVATSNPSGFLEVRVRPPGPGAIRLSWTSPAGEVLHSRGAGITAGF